MAVLFAAGALHASASSQSRAWDATQVRGKTRVVEFETSEGTWMSVTASPVRDELAFDLLGRIYALPATGGRAIDLTRDAGASIDIQPRFSPDGRTIAFISDRSGQDNLWLMDADGARPRPLLLDRRSRFTQPAWLPDGRAIVAVRHFPTMDGMHRRVASLWWVPVGRDEAPRQLLASADANFYDPAVTPDGKSLYFMKAHLVANRFGTESGHIIQRMDFDTGQITDVVRFPVPDGAAASAYAGGATQGYAAMAPRVSPDGSYLAYARQNSHATVRYRSHAFSPTTELWLRDLRTGSERRLHERITLDLAGAHAMFSQSRLPMYAWSADSSRILISIEGKLVSLDVQTAAAREIPFVAHVRRSLSEQAHGRLEVPDGKFTSRFLQWPATSPDGTTLAVVAGGHLWLVASRTGAPRRVATPSPTDVALTPSWSPDGRWLAFTTWNERDRGSVWKVAADGGTPQRVTSEAAEYISPVWNPRGPGIAVLRGARAAHTPYAWSKQTQWQVVGIDGLATSSSVIYETAQMPEPPLPRFGADGQLYLQHYDKASDADKFAAVPRATHVITTAELLRSISPVDGLVTDRLKLVRGLVGSLSHAIVSPDGRWLALQSAECVFVGPVPGAGSDQRLPTIEFDPNDPQAAGFERLGALGGYYPNWTAGGRLEFVSGPLHFSYEPATRRLHQRTLAIRVEQKAPEGTLALLNARVITLDRQRIIERGAILVSGNRIKCVGDCDVRRAQRSIDLAGRTVVPGFVDVHAHFTGSGDLTAGVIPQHHAPSASYLAYGVTTAFDPATSTWSAFALQEQTAMGRVTGPRTFSAAEPVLGFFNHIEIESLDDARFHAQRRKLLGVPSLKDYRLTRRDQSQMLAQAAREAGLSLTAEGGGLNAALAFAIDGHTGWEHYVPQLPLYRDAAEFFGRAGIVYSPTVNVAGHPYGALWYWRARQDLRRDEKFMRFMPREAAENMMSFVRPVSAESFSFAIVAEGLADIIHAGGVGAIGSHGEDYGLGSQHEIWSYAAALSPLEALTVASHGGARFLGLERELGTIREGKLADLVILEANPLEDIRNTQRVEYVMKNGVLYDGGTLDELWPQRIPFGPVQWDEP